MAVHTITVSDTPEPADVRAVFDVLVAFNDSKVGTRPVLPLGIFIRDESGAVIGGLTGQSWADWLFIDMLIVPAHLRGAGVGRDLMMRAEACARERGCTGIRLDTFSFQAPGFYRKLGFEEFARLENYPGSQTRHFMAKKLK